MEVYMKCTRCYRNFVVKSFDLSVLKKTVKELLKKEGKVAGSLYARRDTGLNAATP